MSKLKIKLPNDPFLSPYRVNDVSSWTRLSTEWMGAREKFILMPPGSQNKYLIKFPNYGENEIITEIFNCYFAQNLNLTTAFYFPCVYNGQKGVITRSFLKQGVGAELWEMKELICHYSNVPNIEFRLGRDKDVLLEHNIDSIALILQTEFGDGVLFDFFRMIGFDCLIGHGDRHWCNYGVILSQEKNQVLNFRFAPIYDTASGYLLEMSDEALHKILESDLLDNEDWHKPRIAGLCKITCNNNHKTNHVELFEYILENSSYTKYIDALLTSIRKYDERVVRYLLGNYFSQLPKFRQTAIIKILEMRSGILKKSATQRGFKC